MYIPHIHICTYIPVNVYGQKKSTECWLQFRAGKADAFILAEMITIGNDSTRKQKFSDFVFVFVGFVVGQILWQWMCLFD